MVIRAGVNGLIIVLEFGSLRMCPLIGIAVSVGGVERTPHIQGFYELSFPINQGVCTYSVKLPCREWKVKSPEIVKEGV